MAKKVSVRGFSELTDDIRNIANQLGSESRATSMALEAGIKPIFEQMQQNASSDPKRISGVLYKSIKTGKVTTKRNGAKKIDAGVHYKDMNGEKKAYYANPVEFGHGGPAPAPAHPFIQPAFDARAPEAYQEIRRVLGDALDASKR